MKKQKKHDDSDQADLNQHGVKSIVPDDDEYYTLNLKRGDDTDTDNIPELDITATDPATDIDEPTKSSSFYEGQVVQNRNTQRSSNDGGPVANDDIVEQDSVSRVAGEPGGNVDEDTG